MLIMMAISLFELIRIMTHSLTYTFIKDKYIFTIYIYYLILFSNNNSNNINYTNNISIIIVYIEY